METTSLISTFDTNAKLIGVGIDAEQPKRFIRWADTPEESLPLVFSHKEIDHYQSLSDTATGLCMSFCCKEAFFKALRQPYDRVECELFWQPGLQQYTVSLSRRLQTEFEVSEALAQAVQKNGECVVNVFVFRSHIK